MSRGRPAVLMLLLCSCAADPPFEIVAAPAASDFDACEASTPERSVAEIAARIPARSIAIRLGVGDPLYRGRGAEETARLRTWLFLMLARDLCPPEAQRYLLEELLHGRDLRLIAAACRAAGALHPPASEDLLKALRRLLEPRLLDEPLDLEHALPEWPVASPTTLRLEAIAALRRLKAIDAATRLKLETLAAAPDAPLRTAAQAALSDAAPCCSAAPKLRSLDDWIPPAGRSAPETAEMMLVDQDAAPFNLESLKGRLTVICAFYTRCDNPNKCPLAIARLAQLQAILRDEGLEDRVTLLALTLDPAYDTPERLRRFAGRYDLKPGTRCRLAAAPPETLPVLLASLDWPAALGRGTVAAHGIALLLLDRRGRPARRYHTVAWENASVVADLRRLLEE